MENETPPDPDRLRWAEETIAMMRGEVHRVWVPNPRMMEYQQEVGHWETRRKIGATKG